MKIRIVMFALLFGWAARQPARAQAALDESPQAVHEGMQVFRGKCAKCHDLNGQGYKGRDLTQLSGKKMTNAQLAKIITDGIAGTEMPPNKLDAAATLRVIAYLRTLGGPAVVDAGDARRGESLFWGKARCGSCHMVAGRGGRLGPDLTQIGAMRSKAFLVREIRDPDEYIGKGFDPIRVVTGSGEAITGVRKNDDLFSLQMMDEHENLRVFVKDEIREVRSLDHSLMPAYRVSELSAGELDDVLRYVASLR